MDIDIHTTAGKLADLGRRIDEAVHAGSASAVEKQHAKGKMTARERVLALLDEGSFAELDEFARHRSKNFGMDARRPYGDGVITGTGAIHGRPVCVFSQDVTIFGGALGEVYGEKIVKIIDFALKTGCPLIGINEGGGARIQEGVVSLALYGEIFRRNTRASGVIPQISLIMGAAAGGHVYSPALTDFVVMVDKTSQMFITGPEVIRTVTGEDVSMEELGGGRTHSSKSGNSHYLAADENDALEYVRDLISYLPQNNLEDPPRLRRRRGGSDHHRPRPAARPAHTGFREPALRHARDHPQRARRRGVPRGHGAVRRQCHNGFRTDRGPPHRHRRQPADRVRRLPRHRRIREGRAFRPHLRRLQHPGADLRRRPPVSFPASIRSTRASSVAGRS